MESLNQTRFSGADAGDARAKLSELKQQGTEQASEPAREPDAELQAQRDRAWALREPAAVQTALALIRTDPELYGPVADILRRREELIDGTAEDGRRNRNFAPLLAGIMANERTAKVLDGAIDTTVEAETHVIKAELEQGEVYVPEIVIGSGPHAAIYNATRLTSGESALTVERDDAIGGTFARANGPAFRLNSRTRPESVDTKPVPGTGGNLNTLGSSAVLQLPDVTGEAYAMQHKLGEVTRVNHLLASRIATGMRLVDAEVVDDPAVNGLLRLTFEDAADTGDDEADQPAKTYTVTTDRVIMASSISEPRTGFEQAGKSTTRILKQEARAFRETGSAQIMTSEQADEYFGNPDNTEALKGVRRAVVIGSGDGGRIRVEDLLGYSGIDRGPMQLDRVEKLTWIGQSSTTKEEFERTVRPRYRSLGLEFPREDEPDYYSRIEPVNSKATKLKRDAETGLIIVVTEDGREIPADLVVLETGYRDTTGEIFSKLAARPERITKPEEVAARLDEALGTDGAVVRFKPEVQESFGGRADISTSSLDRVNSNVRFQLARDATDASTTETMAFAKQVFFRPELIESIELPVNPSDQPVDVDNVIARAVDPAEQAPERDIIQGDDEQARLKLSQDMQAVTTIEDAEKFIGLTIRYRNGNNVNSESITGVKVSQDGTPQFTIQSEFGGIDNFSTVTLGAVAFGRTLSTFSELESIELPAALSQTANPDSSATTLPDATPESNESQPVILETQEQITKFFERCKRVLSGELDINPESAIGLTLDYAPSSGIKQEKVISYNANPGPKRGFTTTATYDPEDDFNYRYRTQELLFEGFVNTGSVNRVVLPPALAAELGFVVTQAEGLPDATLEASEPQPVILETQEQFDLFFGKLRQKIDDGLIDDPSIFTGLKANYDPGFNELVGEEFVEPDSTKRSLVLQSTLSYRKGTSITYGYFTVEELNGNGGLSKNNLTSISIPPALAAELGFATQAEALSDATPEANEPQPVVLDTREQLNKLTDTFRDVVNGNLSVDDASMAGLRITYQLLDTPTAQLVETVSFDPTVSQAEGLSSLVYRKDGTEFANYRYSGAADVFDQLLVEQLTSVTLPPALAAELGFAAPDIKQSAEAKEVQVGETLLTDLNEINRLGEKLLQPGIVVRYASGATVTVKEVTPYGVRSDFQSGQSPSESVKDREYAKFSPSSPGRILIFNFRDQDTESVTLPPALAAELGFAAPDVEQSAEAKEVQVGETVLTDLDEINRLGEKILQPGVAIKYKIVSNGSTNTFVISNRTKDGLSGSWADDISAFLRAGEVTDYTIDDPSGLRVFTFANSEVESVTLPPELASQVLGQPNFGPDGKTIVSRTLTDKAEIQKLGVDDLVVGMSVANDSATDIYASRVIMSIENDIVMYDKVFVDRPDRYDMDKLSRDGFLDLNVRESSSVTIPEPTSRRTELSIAEGQPATDARTIASREEIDSLKLEDLVPGTVLTENDSDGKVITRTVTDAASNGIVSFDREPALGLPGTALFINDLLGRTSSVTFPAAPRPVNDGAVAEGQRATEARTITSKEEIDSLKPDDLVPGTVLTEIYDGKAITRTILSVEDGEVRYDRSPAIGESDPDTRQLLKESARNFIDLYRDPATSVTIPAAPRPVNDSAVVESQRALKVRTITDRAEIKKLTNNDLVPGMIITRNFQTGPVTRTVISVGDGRVVYEQSPALVATDVDSTQQRSAAIADFTNIYVSRATSVTIPMQANTAASTSLPSAMKLSPQDAKPSAPRPVERKVPYNPPSTRSGEPLTYQEVLTDPTEIQRYGDDIAKTVGSQIEFRTGDIEYARVIGIEPEAAGAVVFLRVKRKDRTVDSLEKTRASTFASEYLANPDISAVRIQRSVPAELVLGPDGEPIARKVKGVPVYLVGPGAQIPVTDAERAKSTAYSKIPDNAVALFRYAGKTEALANEFNARPLPPTTVGRVLPGREKLRQPKYLKSIPETDIEAAFVPREIVEFPSEQIASTHVGRDEFRLAVGQLLRDYRLPAEMSAISFDATVEDLQNGTSKLSVDGQPIPVSDIGSVFYQLIDDPTIRAAIKQHSDMRRGLSKHAQVVIPFIDGRVDVANISIQQVREPRLA